jgi:hypothetical protein
VFFAKIPGSWFGARAVSRWWGRDKESFGCHALLCLGRCTFFAKKVQRLGGGGCVVGRRGEMASRVGERRWCDSGGTELWLVLTVPFSRRTAVGEGTVSRIRLRLMLEPVCGAVTGSSGMGVAYAGGQPIASGGGCILTC